MIRPQCGLGVDLVDVSELDGMIASAGIPFVQAGWTRAEVQWTGMDSRRLAVCWAVKEAVMKALGAGLEQIDPLDLEVHVSDTAECRVHMSGTAAEALERLGGTRLTVSVGGDKRFVLATAFAWADR